MHSGNQRHSEGAGIVQRESAWVNGFFSEAAFEI
jgi:hypothetical protein